MLIAAVPGEAAAQARVSRTAEINAGDFGLGLIVGDPAAIGGRYWISRDVAAQVWVGGTYQYRGPQVSVDLLYGIHNIIPTSSNKVAFDLAFGGGLAVGSRDEPSGYHCHNDPWRYCHTNADPNSSYVALRAPVSFSLILRKLSLEVFAEVAAGVGFVPLGRFEIDAGMGARYYF